MKINSQYSAHPSLMFTLNRHLLNRFFSVYCSERKEKYKQNFFHARERISNSKSFTLQKDTTFVWAIKSTLLPFLKMRKMSKKMCLKASWERCHKYMQIFILSLVVWRRNFNVLLIFLSISKKIKLSRLHVCWCVWVLTILLNFYEDKSLEWRYFKFFLPSSYRE